MNHLSFIQRYAQLIATSSISSSAKQYDQSNQSVISLLATWCADLGFDITIEDVAQGKQNLIAKKGQGDGGLVLSGHSDTVSFDSNNWQSDPFILTEKEGRFYGLGSADMKGFFAFILQTVIEIDWATQQKPLYIVATCDEETSMSGVRHLVANSNIKPDCCLIGEPTSLVPIRAHKGHMANSIRVTGRSGHSSDPSAGINAIEIMNQVIQQLLIIQQKLIKSYFHPGFQIPHPTLNLGHIHGGENPNTICGCCELHFDLRPLPGMSLSAIDQLIREGLQPVLKQWPDSLTVEALHDAVPGFECPNDNPFVLEVEKLSRRQIETVNYCTEAPFLQQLCPTLVIGPGSILQAHKANEYLDKSYYQPTIKFLKNMIKNYCF